MTGVSAQPTTSLRLLAPVAKPLFFAQGRQRSHLAVLPNEPEIDITDIVRRRVESRAAQKLP